MPSFIRYVCKVLLEQMYQSKESIMHSEKVKANHLLLTMRDRTQTNGVFAPKNYHQNQPFFVMCVEVYMLAELLF